MLRLTKMSVLVLASLVLCAGLSMASGPAKGGNSVASGQSANSSSARIASSKGSNSMILPTGSSTKVVTTRVIVTQTSDPKTSKVITTQVIPIDPKSPQVINTKVTMVVPGQVVNGKYTMVIPTQVVNTKVSMVIPGQVITGKVITTQVIVTQVVNPQVIINPVQGGGCGCGNWIYGILSYFGFETPAVPVQYERFLRLHNDTNEKMVVYLRYHTQDVTGQWDWIPEAPTAQATKWVAFELAAGEVLEPKLGELPIAANRIRLYAESATRKWETFKDDDFWLVPEVTAEGEHLYYSETRQTFDFYVNGTK